MARVVELTENELLLFRQDVASFKRTIDGVDEVVRAQAEGSADLAQSVLELCETLRTMTQKLEQVLVVNERLEKLLNRIDILEAAEDQTDPNTSISEPPVVRNTDIRELQPPDIFAPCQNCQQAICQCVQDDGTPVCESCLEDPCTCMAQYETRPDTSL